MTLFSPVFRKHRNIRRIRLYLAIALAGWTALLALSIMLELSSLRGNTERTARAEALMAYEKDALYRRWASRRGGVYVEVSPDSPPNLHLSHVPERDISTPSGRHLTLVNPAYMTRQVFQTAKEFAGPQGHIASLRPLYHGNQPDPWEAKCLRSFERGTTEASSVESMAGQPYMRFMRPFIAEESCLKCHGVQGYKVGDVVGGISVAVPMAGLLAAQQEEVWQIWGWHGLLWLLGCVVIGWGGRRIGLDTVALVTQEERLTERNEELVMTEEELRQQVDEYQQAQNELQAEKNKLETIMASMGDGLIIVAPDYRIIYQNRVITALFGDRTGELCYQAYRGKAERCLDCPVDQSFADGKPHTEELTLQNAGRELCFEVIASPLRDWNGSIVAVVEVLRDVTERKKAQREMERLNASLEERVYERTALLESEIRQREAAQYEIGLLNEDLMRRTLQLEQSNRELESFSYSVSHDLRAPLRHINGFSHALAEEFGDLLNEECRGYLQRIDTAASRMGVLIDDLLSLARVTQAEMRHERVDLSGLCVQVLKQLQETAPARQVEWTVAPDVAACGDPLLLRQLMENLLGNAWKYTANADVARIEFGRTEWEGTPCCFIRDNGVGFDMQYADKLFKAFQRLHGTEFEGSGIGLATVQRIIARHGGRIWAESAVGCGATFYFVLPGCPDR